MTGETPPAVKGVTATPEPWELEAAAIFMDHVDDDETGSVHRVAAFLREVAALFPLPAPEAGEAQPVTWQWRALEDGEPKTAWKDPQLGDRPGWEALAKRNPEKYATERRALYSVPLSTPAAPELGAVKVKPLDETQRQGWRDDKGRFCIPLSDGLSQDRE